ncbi:MAG: hypothetical protein ACN6OP_01185 [Pseudomonadales bacterium]
MPPMSFGSALTGLLILTVLVLAAREVLCWFLKIPAQQRLARENNKLLRSLHNHLGIPLPEGVMTNATPAIDKARAAAMAYLARNRKGA